MAYDLALADRIRDALAAEPDVTERRMFGGLAFMLDGRMTVTAGRGALMVRVDPADSDALVAEPLARPVVMRGREMRGWLHVEAAAVEDEQELDRWVCRAVTYVRSLAPAPQRQRRRTDALR